MSNEGREEDEDIPSITDVCCFDIFYNLKARLKGKSGNIILSFCQIGAVLYRQLSCQMDCFPLQLLYQTLMPYDGSGYFQTSRE